MIKMLEETRDSSLSNGQTLNDVVKPKLLMVDEHETALQRTKGAFWAIGILYGVALAVLSIWVAMQ